MKPAKNWSRDLISQQFGSKQTSLLLMTGHEDAALCHSLPTAMTSSEGKEGTTKGFKLVVEAKKFDDGSGSDSESSSGASAKSGSSLLSRRSQSSMYKSGLSISAKDKVGDTRSYRELLESKGYKIRGRGKSETNLTPHVWELWEHMFCKPQESSVAARTAAFWFIPPFGKTRNMQ